MTSILDNPAVRQAVLPVTVDQYHRWGATGLIRENTELLRGIIVEKMIKSPLHSWLVQFLVERLRADLSAEFHVRQEQPLTFTDSEPEPDVAVVAGNPDAYRSTHPSSARLVIEIAVTSLELDREKAGVYAAAGVGEYLIIVPDQQCVEVYTDPQGSGYREVRTFRGGERIRLTSLPDVTVDLSALFQN
jgi:Uma2 family endonuclease